MIGTVDGGANDVIFDLNAGYDFEGGNASWEAFFICGPDDSNDLLVTPPLVVKPALAIQFDR